MKPIRLCHLITELAPAGAERCVYELARRLDRRRFHVEVAALRGGSVARWLAEADVPVHVLGLRGRWDMPKLFRLAGVFGRGRFDILHTHLFHADLAGRAARLLSPTPRLVHTVHVAEGRFRPWQFAWARLLSNTTDRIICVSRAVRDFHQRRSGVASGKYVVIPNGVDCHAYRRDVEARQDLRRRWGVGDDEVLLAYVGRLDQQKGIDTLLEALGHLAGCGRPARIVIAGDGPLRPMIEEHLTGGKGGQACIYLGFTEDVRGVFSAADVAVMPSRYEGFPLTALEAMSVGLPVAGTAAPGLSEAVADGLTGLLGPVGDAEALAGAIEHLTGDARLRALMGQAARSRARTMFGIQTNVRRHERLYEELTDGD